MGLCLFRGVEAQADQLTFHHFDGLILKVQRTDAGAEDRIRPAEDAEDGVVNLALAFGELAVYGHGASEVRGPTGVLSSHV